MQIKCLEIIDYSAFNFYLQSPPENKGLFFISIKTKNQKNGMG
jgi:hypothetical protein